MTAAEDALRAAFDTERRRLEGECAASEQRLQLALQATDLGLWERDLISGTLSCSGAALTILGFADGLPEDPDAVRQVVHPEDVEVLWLLDEAARSGERFHAEYRIVRPDGSTRWVANHARAVRGEDGLPARMIGTLADITARKQVEHELRIARDELEARVLQRTDALAEANTALINEVAERRAAEEHAHALLGQLVTAEEEERKRLSREMHDTLGQHIAALAIGMKAIALEAELPQRLRERIEEMQQVTGELDDEIGRLAHELRPVALDDLGLSDALQRHARNWSRQSGVSVEVYAAGMSEHRFSPAIETTVFRVVQEALTNVRRHARAHRVSLIVETRRGELRAIVEDDGRGFDASGWTSLEHGFGPPRGLGLRGMTERAKLCGGRLEIESSDRGGTTVYLTIPLRESST